MIAMLRSMRQRSRNRNLIEEEELLRSGVCGESVENTKVFFSTSRPSETNPHSRIILEHIKTNTRVISDEWRGYLGPENIMTPHDTICHKKHFVGPKNPEKHTQNIESLWRRLKAYIKIYGTNPRKNLGSFIYEFKFKRLNNDIFKSLCQSIRVYKRLNLNIYYYNFYF